MSKINRENSPKHILVCDDIEPFVKIMKLALESEGYKVSTANRGSEAIEKIQMKKPNLLITNLMMPDMSGWDVINYVRQNLKLNTLPILIVSATNEEHFLNNEIAGFLCKPVKLDVFVKKVKSILSLS
ncbi:response regulator [Nostoc flagelliforme FACHB-838]|uniref:Response regulator n=1 Tax=Nostoc flagelliforme FACHB-838 TaxID=2692904 RepID=A0ABR8E2B2_9NOSO|nr:response regulator [Nostoc flagelliforme]MBD2534749.1 response regulator [Nostoc flagelliforme FACHB-838]